MAKHPPTPLTLNTSHKRPDTLGGGLFNIRGGEGCCYDQYEGMTET